MRGSCVLGLDALGVQPCLDARVTFEAQTRVVLAKRRLVLAQKVEGCAMGGAAPRPFQLATSRVDQRLRGWEEPLSQKESRGPGV